MKTKHFENLLGGSAPRNLSPDALLGVNALARRLSSRSEEDELFDAALKRASDEELRALARFRLQSQQAKYMD